MEYLDRIPYGSGINLNIEDLTIPKNIKIIEFYAFYENPYIKIINCEKNSKLEKIADHSIDKNENLQKIYLPISLKEIKNNFYSCPKLKDIFYEGTIED